MMTAEVISMVGEAWVRDAEGNLRELRPGQTLQEGETVVTADGSRVVLDTDTHAAVLVVDGSDELTLGPDTMPDSERAAGFAEETDALNPEEVDRMVERRAEGEATPAAERAPSDTEESDPGEDGHNWVRLDRVGDETAQSFVYRIDRVSDETEQFYSFDSYEGDDREWWARGGEQGERNSGLPDGSITVSLAAVNESNIADAPISGTTTGVNEGQSVSLVISDGNPNTDDVLVTATVGDDGHYSTTADLRGLQEGDLTVTATVEDQAGNDQTATDSSVLDTTPPEVTVTLADEDAPLADGEETSITIDFSEEAFDVDSGEPLTAEEVAELLQLDGLELVGALEQDGDDPTRWTGTVVPAEGFDGEASASIPDASYADEAGNRGSEGEDRIEVDTTPPEVTVTLADEDAPLADGEETSITIDFSEEAFDVDSGEPLTAEEVAELLQLDGLELVGALEQDGDDPTRWTGTVVPAEGFDGEASASIPDASYADEAGNRGSEGEDRIEVDTTPPEVTVTLADEDAPLADGEETSITIDFSEEAFDVDSGEPLTAEEVAELLQLDGLELVGALEQDGDDPTRWTGTVVPAEGFDGEASASIPDASYADEAGNRGSEGEDRIDVDSTPPTLAITSDDSTLGADEETTLTFEFSEPVDGFTESDIQVTGGTLVPGSLSTQDDQTWTAEFIADGESPISVEVADSTYTDMAGNPGSGDRHEINAAPAADGVAAITAVDDEIVLDVLANDSDPDGDDLSITEIDGNAISPGGTVGVDGGTVTLIDGGDDAGRLRFTPDPDFDFAGSNGQVEFDYTISDGEGGSDTATVTVGIVDVAITDNARPDGDGGVDDSQGDDVLASIDDLENVEISGQIPAGGSVVSLIVSSGGGGDPVSVGVGADDINSDGTFSVGADLGGLPDGDLTVTLVGADSEGNQAQTDDGILKDTVTEVAIQALEADNQGNITEIVGSGEPGDTVSLEQVDSDGNVTPIPGAESIVVDQDGNWSFTPGDALGDLVEVRASATDAFGNTAQSSRFVPGLDLGDSIAVSESGIVGDGDQPAGTDADNQAARTDSGTLAFSFAQGEDLATLEIAGQSFDLSDLQDASESDPLEIVTEYGTLTVTGYDDSGDTAILSYSYTLTSAADHSQLGEDERFIDELALRLTDTTGDVRNGILEVAIEDDSPLANDMPETQDISEGDAAFDGTNLIDNDSLGADGAVLHTIYYTDRDGEPAEIIVGEASDVGGEVQEQTVETEYGELTIRSDGSWSYSVLNTVDHAGEDEVIEAFDYDLIDGDGSVSESRGTKEIRIADTEPEVGEPQGSTVSEANLTSGTDPDEDALTVGGNLDVSGNDPFLVSFDAIESDDSLYGETFTAGGETVYFQVGDDGGTLIASTDQSFENEAAEVFTVTLTDREQSLEDALAGNAPSPGYEFTLKRPLDQADDEESLDLGFDFTVQEQGGDADEYETGKDSASGRFTVTVDDDVITDGEQTVEVDEDSSQSFLTPAEAVGDTITIDEDNEPDHGVVTIDPETGAITYTPDPNFSGEDGFTYQYERGDGEVREVTVSITVNPVSDAPLFDVGDAAVTVNEDPVEGQDEADSRVALGFEAPMPGDLEDNSAERLGAIELSGIPQGAKLVDGNGEPIDNVGDENGVIGDGAVQFVISEYLDDNSLGPNGESIRHADDWEVRYPDAVEISLADFESLEIRGPDHDATNFTVTGGVTSYEVDDDGNPLDADSETLTSRTEASVEVQVQAVTDPVDLSLNADSGLSDDDNIDNVDINNGTATVRLDEDSPLDLARLLTADFEDLTGSEERWIEISGVEEGTFVTVNGQIFEAGGDGLIEIPAAALGVFGDGESRDLPTLELTPPEDFSGDISDITITLNAIDRDPDGPSEDGELVQDTVALNLEVTPVPNEIEDLAQVEIDEFRSGEDPSDQDGRTFLTGIEPQDTLESETITQIVVNDIPDGWTVFDEAGNQITVADGSFTISESDIENGNFRDYTIRAPENRSEDIDLSLDITVDDTGTVGGEETTVTETFEGVVLPIKVQPVAGTVADGDIETPDDIAYNNDVEGGPGVKQDDWYDLNNTAFTDDLDGGESLSTGWSNADGGFLGDTDDNPSETTFAQLTPRLARDDEDNILGQGEDANGVTFRWQDDSGDWVEVAYNGTPVDVPVEFLDTLQMRGGPFQAGEFEVEVRAKTVDPGENDDDTESVAVSDEPDYLLTGIVFEPDVSDPDDITLNVTSSSGQESSQDIERPIDLDIDLRSTDPYEIFNITLEGIPEGAVVIYDGQRFDSNDIIDDGDGLDRGQNSVSINDFDPSADLQIITAPFDNRDFRLELGGEVMDAFEGREGEFREINDLVPRPIRVNVEGVADDASIDAVEDAVVSEADVAGSGVVLDQLINAQSLELDDADGSERLTLRLEGLDSQFSIQGAGVSSLGGSGEGRQWLIDLEIEEGQSIQNIRDALEGKLGQIQLTIPDNFSGEVSFQVTPITTEDDGDSGTHESTEVRLDVTPVVTAAIATSVTAQEDAFQQLDFDLVGSPEVKNETLTAVRINAADIEAGEFELYLGAGDAAPTLAQAAAGGNDGVTLDGGWLEITGDALGNIYLKGDPNFAGDELSFGVEYDIQVAPWTGYEGNVEPVTETSSATYGVTIEAVTDDVTMDLVSVDGDVGASSITVDDNRSFDVVVGLSKDPDPDADDEPDHDGSERLEYFVIDGVPLGVVVEGAEFIGETPGTSGDGLTTGQWRLNVNEDFEGPLEQTLSFRVEGDQSRFEGGFEGDISITAFTRDYTSDGNPASAFETDTVNWDLIIADEFAGSDPDETAPVAIATWEVRDDDDAILVEDQPQSLANLMTGELAEGGGSFSISLSGVPEGTEVAGMTETSVNGETVFYAAGSGDNAALQDLLQQIQVTAPDNGNDNNLDNFGFDATLTTYAPNGDRNVQSQPVEPDVVPVTDPFEVTIALPSDASESQDGEDDLALGITLGNPADGAFAQLLDAAGQPSDTVYVRVDDSQMDAPGELLWNGEAVTATETIDGDTYFVLDGVMLDGNGGASLDNLSYRPAQFASGSVDVSVAVFGLEQSAENIERTDASQSFTIDPVNSGLVAFSVDDAVGLERDGEERDDPIQINVSALELSDDSELVQSAFFEGVPNGYTIIFGDDAASAQSAINAGSDGDGTNKWSIPVSEDGTLPAYIGIVPPRYESGKIEGIQFTALSGEPGLEPDETSESFDLTVVGVADGIDISPNPSFGNESEPVRLNLNADMKDFSGSETATFEFTGLGEGAAFYLPTGDGGELELAPGFDGNWSYDAEDGGTYTLAGVPSDMINQVHVLQAGSALSDPEVRAKTVEPNDFDDSIDADESDFTEFENLRLEISPVTPSEGDDTLLYSGDAIDALGGEDTILLQFNDNLNQDDYANFDNIERFDLTNSGSNTLDALRPEDVLEMTDEGNLLEVLGTEQDEVGLADAWEADGMDNGFSIYKAILNGNEVELRVQSEVTVDQ